MNDWLAFIESVPWFLDSRSNVRVLESKEGVHFPPLASIAFPILSDLLAKSTATPVIVNDINYLLLAWDSSEGHRFGWICLPPSLESAINIHSLHTDLLRSFGGIVERFNEPEDTWLLNHNEVLTAHESSHDATFINDYMWAFDNVGAILPIRLSDYYSIAREANGNSTLCHRSSGKVVLFAPDHAFDFVSPLEGCPEYTLYRLIGVETFRDWVEAIASQWLAHLARST